MTCLRPIRHYGSIEIRIGVSINRELTTIYLRLSAAIHSGQPIRYSRSTAIRTVQTICNRLSAAKCIGRPLHKCISVTLPIGQTILRSSSVENMS